MRSESPDNVANLIAKPVEEYEPEPRYVSKYRSRVIRESKRGKSAHKTLGVPSVDLGSPSQFLRKRSGSVPKKLSVRHEHYRRPDYQRKLPEWQPIKAADKEKGQARTSVDFEKRNIEEAKKLRPSGARMHYVDDRHGTSQPLGLSGMQPHYINRKSYGIPPGRVSKTIERHSARRSSPRRETRGQSKAQGNRKHEESKNRRISPAGRAKESFFHKEGEKRKSKEQKEKMRDRRGKSMEREGKAKDGREKSRRGTSPRTKEKIHESRKKSMRRRAEGETEVEEETEVDGGAKINGEDEGSHGNSRSEEEARQSRESTMEGDSRTESRTNDEEEQEEEEEERRSRSTSVRTRKKEGASTARTMEYQQPRCRYVTEDERAELLYGMKKKWDEMMKEFQGLPFLTDTQPKAKRKSQMEKDLSQLEKDIETIERHPYIYVYSDSEE